MPSGPRIGLTRTHWTHTAAGHRRLCADQAESRLAAAASRSWLSSVMSRRLSRCTLSARTPRSSSGTPTRSLTRVTRRRATREVAGADGAPLTLGGVVDHHLAVVELVGHSRPPRVSAQLGDVALKRRAHDEVLAARELLVVDDAQQPAVDRPGRKRRPLDRGRAADEGLDLDIFEQRLGSRLAEDPGRPGDRGRVGGRLRLAGPAVVVDVGDALCPPEGEGVVAKVISVALATERQACHLG